MLKACGFGRLPSADEIAEWRQGYSWLAGGTWLFSEPQPATDTLIDLDQLNWPAIEPSSAGVDIAATCRIAELYRLAEMGDWPAMALVQQCCNSFLASFKIWNAATIGGNICMSLPAGPMISLTVALEAIYTLHPRNAAPREVSAVDFVTGNHAIGTSANPSARPPLSATPPLTKEAHRNTEAVHEMYTVTSRRSTSGGTCNWTAPWVAAFT